MLLDLVFGDPNYPFHPVRLIGWTLTRFENLLRRVGLDGYGGGIALFFLLSVVWVGGSLALLQIPRIGIAIHIFLVYSLLAMRDLLRHGRDVANAPDLATARVAIAKLVGRDTSMMDLSACRRAAIESISENLTDGFMSAIFWYAIGGIPGLVLFKVVSTMDSMVGYKTPQYLHFGWCGARSDDMMNWIPARITWLLMSAVALAIRGCSATKAWRIGWQQHGIVPGPNAGWSEAAMAGAIQRRLVGPIWMNATLVTDVWLGDAADPPAEEARDFERAAKVTLVTGLIGASLAIAILFVR